MNRYTLPVVLMCLLLVNIAGCSGKRRVFTVTDHRGETYSGLVRIGYGPTWDRFQGADGKIHVFSGDYSYVEE